MVGVYSMEDVVWWNGRSAAWAVTIVVLALPDPTRAQSACTESDSTAAIAIRQRLAQWVTAWNHGDADGAAEIWAEDGSTDVVGLAARGPAVTDSAAYAAAQVQNPVDAAPGQGTFSLTVEEIAATGGFAGVRDVWVETRRLPGAAGVVQRTIRGGELWQCQPDGWWRIARRYFVAPAPWVRRTAE